MNESLASDRLKLIENRLQLIMDFFIGFSLIDVKNQLWSLLAGNLLRPFALRRRCVTFPKFHSRFCNLIKSLYDLYQFVAFDLRFQLSNKLEAYTRIFSHSLYTVNDLATLNCQRVFLAFVTSVKPDQEATRD